MKTSLNPYLFFFAIYLKLLDLGTTFIGITAGATERNILPSIVIDSIGLENMLGLNLMVSVFTSGIIFNKEKVMKNKTGKVIAYLYLFLLGSVVCFNIFRLGTLLIYS